MKKKIVVVITLPLVVISILIFIYKFSYYDEYKGYAENMLNTYVYNTCDSIVEMNAIIGNVIDKGYVLDNELADLKDLYGIYMRNFFDYYTLTKYIKKYDFYEIDPQHIFNYKYSRFYTNIEDLFDHKDYHLSFGKQYLNENYLDVFNDSYKYSSSATAVIKKYIDYYNTFEVVIVEDEFDQGNQSEIMKKYKNEYLEPWTDNTTESGSEDIINTDRSPSINSEKPYLLVKSNNWLNLIKELHIMNTETKMRN